MENEKTKIIIFKSKSQIQFDVNDTFQEKNKVKKKNVIQTDSKIKLQKRNLILKKFEILKSLFS